MRGGYQRQTTPLPPSVIAKRLKSMADNLVLLIIWRNEAENRKKARAIQRVIDKKVKLYRGQGLSIGGEFARLLDGRSWDDIATETEVREAEKTMPCFKYLPWPGEGYQRGMDIKRRNRNEEKLQRDDSHSRD